ncbi:MAG: preprotein translocase subunit SecE [Candidatus Marisimplicoccus sp.]
MSIINFIKESVTELRDNVKWTPRSELLNLSALVIVFFSDFLISYLGS